MKKMKKDEMQVKVLSSGTVTIINGRGYYGYGEFRVSDGEKNVSSVYDLTEEDLIVLVERAKNDMLNRFRDREEESLLRER